MLAGCGTGSVRASRDEQPRPADQRASETRWPTPIRGCGGGKPLSAFRGCGLGAGCRRPPSSRPCRAEGRSARGWSRRARRWHAPADTATIDARNVDPLRQKAARHEHARKAHRPVVHDARRADLRIGHDPARLPAPDDVAGPPGAGGRPFPSTPLGTPPGPLAWVPTGRFGRTAACRPSGSGGRSHPHDSGACGRL